MTRMFRVWLKGGSVWLTRYCASFTERVHRVMVGSTTRRPGGIVASTTRYPVNQTEELDELAVGANAERLNLDGAASCSMESPSNQWLTNHTCFRDAISAVRWMMFTATVHPAVTLSERVASNRRAGHEVRRIDGSA